MVAMSKALMAACRALSYLPAHLLESIAEVAWQHLKPLKGAGWSAEMGMQECLKANSPAHQANCSCSSSHIIASAAAGSKPHDMRGCMKLRMKCFTLIMCR